MLLHLPLSLTHHLDIGPIHQQIQAALFSLHLNARLQVFLVAGKRAEARNGVVKSSRAACSRPCLPQCQAKEAFDAEAGRWQHGESVGLNSSALKKYFMTIWTEQLRAEYNVQVIRGRYRLPVTALAERDGVLQ